MRIAILLTFAACTSAPADVEGSYSGPLTRGDNGCDVPHWTLGAIVSDLGFDTTQSGNNVTMTATGSEAAELDDMVSGHTFQGSVSDVSLNVTIVGTRMRSMQNCTLRLDAAIVATAAGTTLDGELHFREIVLDPSCVFVTDAGVVTTGAMGCDSIATFTDTR